MSPPGYSSVILLFKYRSGLERELSTQMLVRERVMPDFSKPEHEMFTGRRPRAFQFKCCVGTAILGQPPVRRKIELIGRHFGVRRPGAALVRSRAIDNKAAPGRRTPKCNFCLGGA